MLLTTLLLTLPALQDSRPTESAEVAAPTWTFRDRGLEFRHRFGRAEFGAILDDTGSGVAIIDYDGDGWLDLYMLNGVYQDGVGDPEHEPSRGAINRLYRNRTHDWTVTEINFYDMTEKAGVGDDGYGMGAVVGDYDADGDQDLYVLNFGANVFYENNGDGTFTEVTERLGLAGPAELNGNRKWSVSGAFLDHDVDGDLDLYVANYLSFDPAYEDPDLPPEYPYAGPNSYGGQASLLYENTGERFVDVTEAAGLLQPDGKTMGAAFADLDGDGDLDLFEAVDDMQNLVFQNEGGEFTEGAVAAGAAFDADGRATASMHPCIGDVNGDGHLDVFVPDLEFGCLYLGRGKGLFQEASARSGLRTEELRAIGQAGWGGGFGDFDLDGDLDLLVVLGGAFSIESVEPDLLLLNDGEGRFTPARFDTGYFTAMHCGRGSGIADLDNDGDLDFVVNHKDGTLQANLVVNELPGLEGERHWLGLELVGTGKNLDALGARVTLIQGDKLQLREVTRSQSYLSQGDHRLLFGLGDDPTVDRLLVRWPDGSNQVVEVEGANRYMRIEQERE